MRRRRFTVNFSTTLKVNAVNFLGDVYGTKRTMKDCVVPKVADARGNSGGGGVLIDAI
jgi:hypothetical protein